MKNYSLKPTEENAIELLKSNPIRRNMNLFRFIDLLDNIKESCTIAINGEWGSGKTFFVRQAKLVIDALNQSTAMDESTRVKILGCYPNKNTKHECHSTVYYDAWMYDNHDDPILSLIYASIASRQTDFAEGKKRSILDGVAALAGALSGRDISSVLQTARGADAFADFKDADDIREMVKEFINSLISEHGNRLVFFIDELDRCKPDYAIRFLERIKHYFDDDRVTFVLSVSLSQLQETVKSYYGAEFDATRYLDKFFDLRISLPQPDMKNYLQTRLGMYEETIVESMCIETIMQYRLSLREAERFARIFRIGIRPAAMKAVQGNPAGNARLFCATYIIPLVLILQMTNMAEYIEFISGRNSKPLLEVLHWGNIRFAYEFLIGAGEEYDENKKTIVIKETTSASEVPVADRLEDVYQALFARRPYLHYNESRIGAMEFSDNVKGYIAEIISLISQLTDYQSE